jgi:hypothetical protein
MMQDISKKEVEKLEKAGERRRMAGRGRPPVTPSSGSSNNNLPKET